VTREKTVVLANYVRMIRYNACLSVSQINLLSTRGLHNFCRCNV